MIQRPAVPARRELLDAQGQLGPLRGRQALQHECGVGRCQALGHEHSLEGSQLGRFGDGRINGRRPGRRERGSLRWSRQGQPGSDPEDQGDGEPPRAQDTGPEHRVQSPTGPSLA